jgi:hypothetical protein
MGKIYGAIDPLRGCTFSGRRVIDRMVSHHFVVLDAGHVFRGDH